MIFPFDGLVSDVLKVGPDVHFCTLLRSRVCVIFQGQVEYQPKEKGNPGRKKMKIIENFLRRSISCMVME